MSSIDPITPGENAPDPTNPYQPPGPEAGDLAEDLVVAECVPRPVAIWPAFVVVIGAILAALFVSGIALAVAAIATGNLQSLRDPSTQVNWLKEFGSSTMGLIILVLPGQLVFLACAAGAALFSSSSWSDRLGFGAGRLPVWSWLFFLLGTPVIGMLAAQLMSSMADEPSEQMKMLEQMFQYDSIGGLLLLLLLVSVLPGLIEEMLFRGYMQRRLLSRLPALVSIVICSTFFAAAHMDPMHAVGVFPLGVWLGVIAWRADSIWPAILGHMGNNGYAIVMSKMTGSEPDILASSPLVASMMWLSLLSFVGSIAVLVMAGHFLRPPVPAATVDR